MFSRQNLVWACCTGILALSCGMLFGNSAVANDDGPEVEVSKLLNVVADKILSAHVDPPTRQQLYLGAIRGLYRSHNELLPTSVASEVSKANTPEQLQAVFDAHWQPFVEKNSFEKDNLTNIAAAGMVVLTVPGASFISPKAFRVQKQLRENQYVGVGIKIAYEGGYPVIKDPFIGGPAYMAGARTEDIILTIDGETDGQDDVFVNRSKRCEATRVLL